MGIYDVDFAKILHFSCLVKMQINHYVSIYCKLNQAYPNFMMVYAILHKRTLKPLNIYKYIQIKADRQSGLLSFFRTKFFLNKTF
jgi:hypothetical protein